MSVVDCGSGFTLWCKLRSESAKEVRDRLQTLFAPMAPSRQLLADNSTVFRSKEVAQLFAELVRRANFRKCVPRTRKWSRGAIAQNHQADGGANQ